jgi:hypothetical protein
MARHHSSPPLPYGPAPDHRRNRDAVEWRHLPGGVPFQHFQISADHFGGGVLVTSGGARGGADRTDGDAAGGVIAALGRIGTRVVRETPRASTEGEEDALPSAASRFGRRNAGRPFRKPPGPVRIWERADPASCTIAALERRRRALADQRLTHGEQLDARGCSQEQRVVAPRWRIDNPRGHRQWGYRRVQPCRRTSAY